MTSKNRKRQRQAVWTHNGSRKWNKLRHHLYKKLIEAKESGLSDLEALSAFADDPETIMLFETHKVEKVRGWNKQQIMESARIRFKQDAESMFKDDEKWAAVNCPEDLPANFPKSLCAPSRPKVSNLQYYFALAQGEIIAE